MDIIVGAFSRWSFPSGYHYDSQATISTGYHSWRRPTHLSLIQSLPFCCISRPDTHLHAPSDPMRVSSGRTTLTCACPAAGRNPEKEYTRSRLCLGPDIGPIFGRWLRGCGIPEALIYVSLTVGMATGALQLSEIACHPFWAFAGSHCICGVSLFTCGIFYPVGFW